MKKLILLICAFAFTLTSCNNDDDSPASDPIVGVWNYYKYFEDGVEQPLDECDALETLIFAPNGSFNSVFYFYNGTDCELDDQSIGTWIGQGNLYTITTDGISSTELVTFENNTFYIEYTETFNGVTTTERDVYIRQ